MSRYQVYLIRSSLLYLLLTALLGFLFYLSPRLAAYARTTHLHLGFLGFFLMLVMGVAFWLMPRPGGLRQEAAEARCFYLMNLGMLLRLAAEPLWQVTRQGLFQSLSLLAAFLHFCAISIFVWAMWQRVVSTKVIQERSQKRA